MVDCLSSTCKDSSANKEGKTLFVVYEDLDPGPSLGAKNIYVFKSGYKIIHNFLPVLSLYSFDSTVSVRVNCVCVTL